MDEEESKSCPNCKREIPAVNFTIHSVHCTRNIKICPVCKEPVPTAELDVHHQKMHKLLPCKQCGESVCGTDLEDHIRDSCANTVKSCRFCELELPRRELPTHEGYCGVRTEQCTDCKEYVMLKYQQLHLDSNHGFIRLDDDPAPPKKEPPKSNITQTKHNVSQINEPKLKNVSQRPTSIFDEFSRTPCGRRNSDNSGIDNSSPSHNFKNKPSPTISELTSSIIGVGRSDRVSATDSGPCSSSSSNGIGSSDSRTSTRNSRPGSSNDGSISSNCETPPKRLPPCTCYDRFGLNCLPPPLTPIASISGSSDSRPGSTTTSSNPIPGQCTCFDRLGLDCLPPPPTPIASISGSSDSRPGSTTTSSNSFDLGSSSPSNKPDPLNFGSISSNTRLASSNTRLGSSNIRPDSSNTRLGSSNIRPDSSNTRLGSSNIRPDSSNPGPSSSNTRPSNDIAGHNKISNSNIRNNTRAEVKNQGSSNVGGGASSYNVGPREPSPGVMRVGGVKKRTNDQPQINKDTSATKTVEKDLGAVSRGAVKKRPAPQPPRSARRDLPYYSAVQRQQREDRERRELNEYNLAHGLPPVLNPAQKVEKLRKLDALQNRECEAEYRGRQRRPSPEPAYGQNREQACGGRSLGYQDMDQARQEFKNLKPMSPTQFMRRFSSLQVAPAPAPAPAPPPPGDRFPQIKSSLRELRRELNEVTAPYNANNNIAANNNNDRGRSPSPQLLAEEVHLPCEFCDVLVPAYDLVQHQTGCRPDLAQVSRGGAPRSPSPGAGPPPLFAHPPAVPVIPCEFCMRSLPVYLISEHQEQCSQDQMPV